LDKEELQGTIPLVILVLVEVAGMVVVVRVKMVTVAVGPDILAVLPMQPCLTAFGREMVWFESRINPLLFG
jgi:hypothetical protein